MKLTDSLAQLGLAPRVAYYAPELVPALREAGLKSGRAHQGAVLLSHLLARGEPGSWIARGIRRIADSTALSPYLIAEARSALVKAGLLEVDKDGPTHRFRVDVQALRELLEARDASARSERATCRAESARTGEQQARDASARKARDASAHSRSLGVPQASPGAPAGGTFDRQTVVLRLAEVGIDPEYAAVALMRVERYAAEGKSPKRSWEQWAEGIARKLTPEEVRESLEEVGRAERGREERAQIEACTDCNSSGLRWNFELDEPERCAHEPVKVPA